MTAPITAFSGEHRWLSNFWPVDVTHEGVGYSSTEAAYQAAKTEDVKIREEISRLSAAEAKRFGKRVTLRRDWESVKVSVMRDLLRLKFAVPDLRERLLATGDAQLVEGNWWGDRFWGVCDGRGENHLGKLIMEIRDEIRAGGVT